MAGTVKLLSAGGESAVWRSRVARANYPQEKRDATSDYSLQRGPRCHCRLRADPYRQPRAGKTAASHRRLDGDMGPVQPSQTGRAAAVAEDDAGGATGLQSVGTHQRQVAGDGRGRGPQTVRI